MKASDISDVISVMQAASQFILENARPSAAEIDMRTKLLRSANRLSAELSMIPIEIKTDK